MWSAICINDLKSLPTKDLKYLILLETLHVKPEYENAFILATISVFSRGDLLFINSRTIYLLVPSKIVCRASIGVDLIKKVTEVISFYLNITY